MSFVSLSIHLSLSISFSSPPSLSLPLHLFSSSFSAASIFFSPTPSLSLHLYIGLNFPNPKRNEKENEISEEKMWGCLACSLIRGLLTIWVRICLAYSLIIGYSEKIFSNKKSKLGRTNKPPQNKTVQ